ncbi:MAG: (Fe-S)-binding protein [Acetivibrionales bacterium]|jgi:Fe-S oxidoreductase
MFTERANDIIDACRFCWMCRHLCPVGLVTGNEGNTPRGRALLLSLDNRGVELPKDAYELIFQCALCSACTDDCVTGYDPPVFIREARTKAIVNDCVPANVLPVLERAMEGNISGKAVNEALVKKIRELDKKAEILLYMGNTASRDGAESTIALMNILEKANVKFTALEDEPDSGALLFDLMGPVEEVRNMAKACIDTIVSTGAKLIISIDPTYTCFFMRQCNEWNLMGDLKVVTATAFVADLIAQGRLKVGKLNNVSATFHDPCRLARDFEETQPARDIINAMGIELKEMFLNRNLTRCCGGPVLSRTYSKVADNMAKVRLEDAESTGTELMITACPCCTTNMSAHSTEKIKIADLFVLLNKALG